MDFYRECARFGQLTGEDSTHWQGYLAALRQRRAFFASMAPRPPIMAIRHRGDRGSTAAAGTTTVLAHARRVARCGRGGVVPRANVDRDGAHVLRRRHGHAVLHAGAWRNHNDALLRRFGRDKGGDFPTQTNFTAALKPLLNLGARRDFTLILFTLDEKAPTRASLAPLAGLYPSPAAGTGVDGSTTRPMPCCVTVAARPRPRASTIPLDLNDLHARIFPPSRRATIPRGGSIAPHLAELVASKRLEEDEAAVMSPSTFAYRLLESRAGSPVTSLLNLRALAFGCRPKSAPSEYDFYALEGRGRPSRVSMLLPSRIQPCAPRRQPCVAAAGIGAYSPRLCEACGCSGSARGAGSIVYGGDSREPVRPIESWAASAPRWRQRPSSGSC